MESGQIPQATTAGAIFFDGITNRRHVVNLRFGEALEIFEDSQGVAAWPYANIRRVDGPVDVLRLSCSSTLPLARLEIREEALKRGIMDRCGPLAPQRDTGARSVVRIVVWSLAAIVSIAAVTIYGVPLVAERLAPLIPMSFENRFGDMADNQVKLIFGDKFCATPAGSAAFTKLVNTLKTAGGLDIPLSTKVIESAIPNAFALPGGRIYLFELVAESRGKLLTNSPASLRTNSGTSVTAIICAR